MNETPALLTRIRKAFRLDRRKSQKGGALDALLYMVIMGAVLLGILYIFRDAIFGNRANDAARDLAQLQSRIQANFYNASTYGTANENLTQAVINAGLVPTNQVVGTNIRNRFGGNITINVNATDNSRFDIVYTAVPRSACSQLVQRTQPGIYFQVATAPGGGAMTVRGTDNDATNPLPPSLATSGTACNANTTDIRWTSY